MKRFFTTITFLLSAFVTSAQSITWNNPVPVANASFGYTRPHIAVCNGVPVAVWGNESTNKIYASRFVDGAFTAPVDVSPDFPAYEQGWMAHEIAAAGDTLFVVFGDLDMSRVYILRSLDGGQTFGDTVRVDDGSEGFMPVVPSVDVTSGGNPVVSFIVSETDFTDARTMVTSSTDGGATFAPAVNVSAAAPGEACDCCKGMMVADANRSVLVFRNNDSNVRQFFASISTDGGVTFPTSAQMDFTNWTVNVCPTSPADGVLINDTLAAVFMSAGSGSNKVYTSWIDLDNTAQPAVQSLLDDPGVGVIQNYPRMDGKNQNLGVVWQQTESGQSKIRFASSFTGPNGFGATVNPAGALPGSHTQPDIAYADNNYYAVFQNDSSQQAYFVSGAIENTSIISANDAATQLFDLVDVSNNVFTLRFNSVAIEAQMRVNAVNGQTVLTSFIGDVASGSNVTFNAGSLSSGVYFVSIVSHQGVSTQRLLIKK